MKNRLSAILILISFAPLNSVTSAQQRNLTPNMRVHKHQSQILSEERYILVWLPPDYNKDQTKRFPVFYMHDGQNKYINWRIDETAQSLIESGQIEPLILVGIYHGGRAEDRFRDYTPTYDPNFRTSGKADAYGRMLVEEIKPFIDNQYRTLSEATNTGLGGASLGGLVSLYLGFKYPSQFGKLASLSPSIWWDDKVIIKNVKKLGSKSNLRIWLDIGTSEGDMAVRNVREMRDTLISRGWTADSDLKYLEAKGAEHNEKAFAQRAGDVLKYLFPAQVAINK